MKRVILSLIASFLMANVSMAGNQNTATINTSDTVVFDLSQLVISGGYAQFPVFILSDDAVNALDFSLKYNSTLLAYDSIINLTTYLQPLSYFNTNDSTLRFTSNSLQPYANNTSLVSIRFNVLSGRISSADLNTIKVYLNGNVCSFKIIDPLPTGIPNISGIDKAIRIYPNPAYEVLHIESPEKAVVQLLDVKGKQIMQTAVDQKQELDIRNLAAGIYMLKIYNDDFISAKKIVISK